MHDSYSSILNKTKKKGGLNSPEKQRDDGDRRISVETTSVTGNAGPFARTKETTGKKGEGRWCTEMEGRRMCRSPEKTPVAGKRGNTPVRLSRDSNERRAGETSPEVAGCVECRQQSGSRGAADLGSLVWGSRKMQRRRRVGRSN